MTLAALRSTTLLLVTLLSIGCFRDSHSDTSLQVLSLPSGGRYVRNADFSEGHESGLSVVVTDLRIGRQEGDGADVFGDIADLAVDEAGRMYVLDRLARQIFIFRADGTHVQTIGREGRGPTEFAEPIAIRWMPGRLLLVVDPGNSRYSVIDSTGAFRRTFPRPEASVTFPWPGGVGADGAIYDVSYRGQVIGEPERVIIRIDATGKSGWAYALPPFSRKQYELRTNGRLRTARVPYAPELVWLLDAPHQELWFGTTDRYQLYQRTLAGDTAQLVELMRKPIPISAEEREHALQSLEDFVRAGGAVDKSRIPATKPLFSGMVLDPFGNLWVTYSGQREPGFDVFRRDGVYLGRVTTQLARSAIPPVITDKAIYGVLTDSVDVAYVVRATINRSPTYSPGHAASGR